MTGQHQAGRLRHLGAEPGIGVEQCADVLAQVQRAQKEDGLAASCRLSCRHCRRPLGPARRAHVHARRADPQLPSHLAGRVVRRHDDGVGTRSMGACQPRVVASNLGRHLLGVPQEIQVVNGDDPGPLGRRDQHGALAVNHVVFARQPLDRGPFQPIPGPHQSPNGNLNVGQTGRRQLGRKGG